MQYTQTKRRVVVALVRAVWHLASATLVLLTAMQKINTLIRAAF